MLIKIVGPGCKNCTALYELTKDVVKDVNEDITIEHVTDVSDMIALGVGKSPGVIIDDKVVSQGKRLKEKEVRALIQKYI